VHLCSNGKWRVLGFDTFNQRWSFQLTTHAHGSSRNRRRHRGRWWRRRRHISTQHPAYNASHGAASNTSLHSTGHSLLAARLNMGLFDNLASSSHCGAPSVSRAATVGYAARRVIALRRVLTVSS
jgi:hypothetical protein